MSNSNTVILSVHTNLIEVEGEENCQKCKDKKIDKKSEVMLHGKRLCFDCTYNELGVALNPKAEQFSLAI